VKDGPLSVGPLSEQLFVVAEIEFYTEIIPEPQGRKTPKGKNYYSACRRPCC